MLHYLSLVDVLMESERICNKLFVLDETKDCKRDYIKSKV